MRFVALFVVVLCASALSADEPRVKVELSPPGEAWVGQRVTLVVALFTPDLFTGSPAFDLPQVDGVILVPPTGSPVVGSEKVDDVSYTTQRHELAVFAQRPGVVRIPPFDVRFQSNAGFGKPVVARRVTTDAVTYTAKTPPGAEKLGVVIAARNLKVEESWHPEPKSAKVGDAFNRTVRITADEVSGMVLPPLGLDEVDGAAAYAKPPQVNDRSDRGALKGERAESVIYVCETTGTVTLPPRTLTWYDLDAKSLATASLPGRTFEVAAAPPAAAATEGAVSPEKPTRGWWIALLIIGFGVAQVFVFMLRPKVQAWRRRRRESEASYFAKFRQACRSGDPQAASRAFSAWLDRFLKTPLDVFVQASGNRQLAAAVADLEACAYTTQPLSRGKRWSGTALETAVAAVRHELQASQRQRVAEALPPLNPVAASADSLR